MLWCLNQDQMKHPQWAAGPSGEHVGLTHSTHVLRYRWRNCRPTSPQVDVRPSPQLLDVYCTFRSNFENDWAEVFPNIIEQFLI